MNPERRRREYGNAHVAWLHTDTMSLPLLTAFIGEKNKEISPLQLKEVLRGQPPSVPGDKFLWQISMLVEHENQTEEFLESENSTFWSTMFQSVLTALGSTLAASDTPKSMLNHVAAMHVHNTHMNYMVRKSGGQTFMLSQGLTDRLMLTDVGHADVADVHLPFDAFILQIPRGMFQIRDERTEEHEVDSVLVCKGHRLDGERKISLLIGGAENENSVNIGDEAVFYSNVLMDSGTIHENIERGIDEFQDVPGNYTAEEVLKNLRSGEVSGPDSYRKIVNFVLASILYITDFPEDRKRYLGDEIEALEERLKRKGGKGRKNAKAKLRRLQRKSHAVQIVGADIEVDSKMTEAARESVREIKVSSYVRGHRKMQPYGPERSFRKPIWVQPYWRNLGNEPVKRPYHVQK